MLGNSLTLFSGKVRTCGLSTMRLKSRSSTFQNMTSYPRYSVLTLTRSTSMHRCFIDLLLRQSYLLAFISAIEALGPSSWLSARWAPAFWTIRVYSLTEWKVCKVQDGSGSARLPPCNKYRGARPPYTISSCIVSVFCLRIRVRL